ncbi:DUF6126 family protein [Streptacidiphilus sp. EB103A]|jgi:hypothetical protein|uniref:DUF6126 family protein n=1 Tax=Streptacidiphilus sp. EB103A TaxID=3156275 RepID=UPI0035141E02
MTEPTGTTGPPDEPTITGPTHSARRDLASSDAAAVLAMIAAADTAAAAQQGDDGSEGGGRRANKGVWIRAFIYVIGFHVFAGFVMLLFYFGGRNH